MPGMVAVILIYHIHKPVDLVYGFQFVSLELRTFLEKCT
jgi:hypothetical protein